MERHGLASATFVGHSLGTMYLAWLARLQPHLLASCVFIDPIVFLLHQHNVAQAFLYSRPSKANFKGHVEHAVRRKTLCPNCGLRIARSVGATWCSRWVGRSPVWHPPRKWGPCKLTSSSTTTRGGRAPAPPR